MSDDSLKDFGHGPSWEGNSALGAIASSWAIFELNIDIVIWSLLNVDPQRGACVTAQFPNVSRRLHALSSLLDVAGAGDSLRKRINQFIEASNTLARRRNRALHDAWIHKGNARSPLAPSFRIELTAETRLRFAPKEVPVSDLYILARDITKQNIELSELAKDADAELGTNLSSLSQILRPAHPAEERDDSPPSPR